MVPRTVSEMLNPGRPLTASDATGEWRGRALPGATSLEKQINGL
jgi:hypothetical protein